MNNAAKESLEMYRSLRGARSIEAIGGFKRLSPDDQIEYLYAILECLSTLLEDLILKMGQDFTSGIN